jgi:hypothetical protein
MANGQKPSKYNAVTHGIFRRALLSEPDSTEAEEFERLLLVEREAIRPRNGLEEDLVEILAIQRLRLERVYAADLKIAPKLFARVSENLDAKNTGFEIDILNLNNGSVKPDKNPTFDLLIRYASSIERQISRTLGQIQQLRQMCEIEIAPISLNPKSSEPESSTPSRDPEPQP